jgi:hypothetical protein
LRTYLQTEKYVRQKNDGTQGDSGRKILRGFSDDNQERRSRLVALLGRMLAEADAYAAGQPLKPKATSPPAILDEALEYLVKNTFTRMGYLKRLNPDPSKEIQAILRSNDIGQQTLALDLEEGNKQAIEDVRNYVGLMAASNKQIVLHDMIEKRYTIRPYGWPDDEVLILVARLLVLGEISLMMDGALVPIDGAYKPLTTPASRRKITIHKRQTTDPKAVQAARSLGKDLFHEMGPDGEDALFAFLQARPKPATIPAGRRSPTACWRSGSCSAATAASSSSRTSTRRSRTCSTWPRSSTTWSSSMRSRGRPGRSSARRARSSGSTGWNSKRTPWRDRR